MGMFDGYDYDEYMIASGNDCYVAIEHGPVEIVDFASYKMLDLLIVM
jgi:hypothetical protein